MLLVLGSTYRAIEMTCTVIMLCMKKPSQPSVSRPSFAPFFVSGSLAAPFFPLVVFLLMLSSSSARNGLYMGGAEGRTRLPKMAEPVSVRLFNTGGMTLPSVSAGGGGIDVTILISSVAVTSDATKEIR